MKDVLRFQLSRLEPGLAVGRQNDHRDGCQLRIPELFRPELVAVHHRHHHVEENHGESVFPQRLQGDPSVLRRRDGVALALEDLAEGFGRGRVVIDQGARGLPFPSAARRRLAPGPATSATPMSPPCAEPICRSIQSPRPRPPKERSDTPRSNCSKMRSRSPGATPSPRSLTVTRTPDAFFRSTVTPIGWPRPNLTALESRFVTTWSRAARSQCPE